MRIGLVYDELLLEHGELWHPENRGRLEAIVARLQGSGLWDEMELLPAIPAEHETLQWVHTEAYLEDLQLICRQGGGSLDADTHVTANSWGAAITAAGGCLEATAEVGSGALEQAICLVRPPGHHALADRAMGFCLLNNAALAAEMALHQGLQRVAIVDYDVHHGNGIQDIFYHRDEVLYISLHQPDLFPGTGTVDEAGVDAGMGHNVNIPLLQGATDIHLQQALESLVMPLLRGYQPELLIISAGFDSHHNDPLAGHEWTTDGYYQLARQLREVAREVCAGRLVVVLEGGYDHRALAHGVENTILAMLDRPVIELEPSLPEVHARALQRVDEHLARVLALHQQRLAGLLPG